MQTLKETAANVAVAAKSAMEKTTANGEKTTATAGDSYSYSATTGQKGQSTGSHQMSALPGHGTGEPAGQVVEGTAKSHPIGQATGRPLPITRMQVAPPTRGMAPAVAIAARIVFCLY